MQNGDIEIRAKTFVFPKLGVTAPRDDASDAATQPKNLPPKKIPVHPKMLHFVATRFVIDFYELGYRVLAISINHTPRSILSKCFK